MKKLFISQPMKDKTKEEIKAERREAVQKAIELLGENVEVIDSLFIGTSVPQDVVKPLWFLGNSLQLLSTADVVYFADGWDKYRGCKIEHTCAVEYGITIINSIQQQN